MFGKSSKKSKHSKLGDQWGENKDSLTDGVHFYLKYIGNVLVEEIEEEGRSYGEGQSTVAVKNIVSMAKANFKKIRKVVLTVSPRGIRVVDLATKEVLTEISIYRIQFCTADKEHDKVFAFIARNTTNETMECQAYLCSKRKVAEAVTLTVAKAFNVAYEDWENSREKKESQNLQEGQDIPIQNNHNNHKMASPCLSRSSAGSPDSMASMSSDGHSLHTISSDRSDTWVQFDDDDLDDCFSKLAESRSKDPKAFLPTDMRPEEWDNFLEPYGKNSSFDQFWQSSGQENLLQL
ncbi:low density lipoprotein receptor adapter protein 1 [Lingula anatina]|uniref:Low density lipoprotein receptor adapter protein 1 n=1 Tax=Lingula anatina TaxID=7574 RepID=A0A1S3IQC1_LINAN|nr:low density lipoprotein receptor adapter protein 1 [Lingula anatina]|eukprot:XP_013400420.1 low density lipoprotein receptor adapter protein 1 [Lingula anatina]